MIVGIEWAVPPAFSSKVTMSRLLWRGAQRAYRPRCFFIQRSPVRIEQSCMSLHMFGLTNATVGSLR